MSLTNRILLALVLISLPIAIGTRIGEYLKSRPKIDEYAWSQAKELKIPTMTTREIYIWITRPAI